MPQPPIRKKPVPARDPIDVKGKRRYRDVPSAFGQLPKEIIHQILYTADPNTFDSLTLLNSRWYETSRSARLYAHQLARCGVTDSPPACEDLRLLTQLFAAAARRELFESILTPRVTQVNLVCTVASAAAAIPGGEAFRFQFSPKGTMLLALTSSRIFVLDLRNAPEIRVTRELKTSKRPVAAAILDDGSQLAVLSSNHRVALYNLRDENARYVKSFPLDNEPRTIALSPGAEVLGAAYDGGIEVYSLVNETNRRAVNCDTVDALDFSPDGTMLLGTAMNPKSPTTVLVSAQQFSIDMPVEGLDRLWTTQVLFPRSSRDSSYASLLPAEHEDEGVAWTFAYDRVYKTFRAVRVEDLRNGHTYFTGPSTEGTSVIPPCTLPAPTSDGSLIAAGFKGGRIWMYGVPAKLDNPTAISGSDTDSVASTPSRSNSTASARLAVPQWQVLSEKLRNVFIRGREISHIPGLSALKFVQSSSSSSRGRLIAVAPNAGGGRIVVHELSHTPCPPTSIAIEIGDGVQDHGSVETLLEETHDLELEIDIARRRTVARRTFPLPAPTPRLRRQSTAPESSPQDEAEEEDTPYSQQAPRSRSTLQRAATVVRHMDLHRYARVVGPDGVPLPENHHQQRVQAGVFNANDNWEPPPPPYTPRDQNPVPLPVELLRTLQPPPPRPAPMERSLTILGLRRLGLGDRDSGRDRGRDRRSVPPPLLHPLRLPVSMPQLVPQAPRTAVHHAPTAPVLPVQGPGSALTVIEHYAPVVPLSAPPTQQRHLPQQQQQQFYTAAPVPPPPHAPFPRLRAASIRRRPSRAERSAARNVQDARRRRLSAMAAEGGRGGGGKCVLM